MRLEIIRYPNPLLRRKSENVSELNQEVKDFLSDLTETMYIADGFGLAAVQAGKLWNIFTINVPKLGAQTFINPEIIEQSEEMQPSGEGCLSFPGIYTTIQRHKTVTLKYRDETWMEREFKYENDMARVVQHELDHCLGIQFIDRMSHLHREMIIKKYNKMFSH
jgi:peptide deformylase